MVQNSNGGLGTLGDKGDFLYGSHSRCNGGVFSLWFPLVLQLGGGGGVMHTFKASSEVGANLLNYSF